MNVRDLYAILDGKPLDAEIMLHFDSDDGAWWGPVTSYDFEDGVLSLNHNSED